MNKQIVRIENDNNNGFTATREFLEGMPYELPYHYGTLLHGLRREARRKRMWHARHRLHQMETELV